MTIFELPFAVAFEQNPAIFRDFPLPMLQDFKLDSQYMVRIDFDEESMIIHRIEIGYPEDLAMSHASES